MERLYIRVYNHTEASVSIGFLSDNIAFKVYARSPLIIGDVYMIPRRVLLRTSRL